MKSILLAVLLTVVAILGRATAASAENSGPDIPADSRWKPTEGRSPSGSFSRADQIILNQVATQGRLEQLCRNFQLKANLSLSLPDAGVSLGVLRRLVTLPAAENPQTLELYQVDEYSPGANLSPVLKLARHAEASLGIDIGTSFALDSTVVRPRTFYKNCAELKALLDFPDVKTVLPLNLLKHGTELTEAEFVQTMAPRIDEMEDGELWSLSGQTTISAAPTVGITDGHVSAGVSIGGTQEGGAIMIVHRLSRNQTRFSLRINHLRIFNAQGTVAVVPIVDIFKPDGARTLRNGLEKIFNSAVSNRLADYLTTSFSALQQVGVQSTQQYLIVFDLDTSDPAQVNELAEIMQSDFIHLLKKAIGMATFQASQRATLAHFDELTKEHDQVLGRVSSVAQTDIGLIGSIHSATLNLPILGQHILAASSSRDAVVTITAGAEGKTSARELHLTQAERPIGDVGFSIPVANKTIVSDISDAKFTSFYFADKGEVQIVYAYLDAFQRRSAAKVQGTLNQFRDMLSVAGSRGLPDADAKPEQFQINEPPHGRVLKSGSIAFSLNIDAAGVKAAFEASPDDIERAVRRVFPHPVNGESAVDQNVDWNDILATKIAQVLVRGRNQTADQRNAALRDLMVAESNSNIVFDSLGAFLRFLPLPKPRQLAYEGTMKVLLQLAKPENVSANLAMTVDTDFSPLLRRGTNFSVNENQNNVDLVDAGIANRERTLPPTFMDVNQ